MWMGQEVIYIKTCQRIELTFSCYRRVVKNIWDSASITNRIELTNLITSILLDLLCIVLTAESLSFSYRSLV